MEEPFTRPTTILVTGAEGQLGKELQQLSNHYLYNFLFTSKQDLSIDNLKATRNFFEQHQIDFCINCAAYTAVDKAETEKERAFAINADAVGNLAQICSEHQTRLIYISTDYVFNGESTVPYKEDDAIDPINTYGASKLKGEGLAFTNNPSTLIIRTSWVYSSFGNNFVKTMIRLMNERASINVIDDQYGCPTYAADLAEVVMKIIGESSTNNLSGILNYCNDGIATWYKFAMAIKELTQINCIINPIPASQYITAAKRPMYSVLDTNKIKKSLGITIPYWRDSLQACLKILGCQIQGLI